VAAARARHLDARHFPRPICGYSQHRRKELFEGQGRGFAAFGIGLGDMDVAIVNGWQFGQRAPAPPDVAAEREPIAAATITGRRWREIGEHWFAVERPEIEAAVAAVAAVDPGALDAPSVLEHLLDARRVQQRAADLHFEHIAVFAVIGELLIACREWGIRPEDAVALLKGASPASAESVASLRPVVDALVRSGVRPASLDDVRGAGPEASAALDEHLQRFGFRLVGGFDVCDVTLHEVPDAVLATIIAALDSPDPAATDDTVSSVRAAVPANERDRFDDLVREARYCYGIRDDDVAPLMTARGLVRRALLATADHVATIERSHVFEANIDELAALLTGDGGPSAADLAERAALRQRQAQADAPPFLGPPPGPPDLSHLPPTVRRLTDGFLAYGQLMFVANTGSMQGFGVGSGVVRGRARVVHRAEEALASLEPGDVLVTTMTTPAFNGVLPLAGALVTEAGGLLSHAAIISRELGVPAVIGVPGVMSTIRDGDEVEVDTTSGAVRVVS
jgi:rifampicin phosphotransferase